MTMQENLTQVNAPPFFLDAGGFSHHNVEDYFDVPNNYATEINVIFRIEDNAFMHPISGVNAEIFMRVHEAYKVAVSCREPSLLLKRRDRTAATTDEARIVHVAKDGRRIFSIPYIGVHGLGFNPQGRNERRIAAGRVWQLTRKTISILEAVALPETIEILKADAYTPKVA